MSSFNGGVEEFLVGEQRVRIGIWSKSPLGLEPLQLAHMSLRRLGSSEAFGLSNLSRTLGGLAMVSQCPDVHGGPQRWPGS